MEIGEPGGFLVWLTQALDSVVQVGRGYQQANTDDDGPGGPVPVLKALLPPIRTLIDTQAVAFFMVADDGVAFTRVHVDPEAAVETVEAEIEAKIADGTFAWALYQDGPVVVPALRDGRWVLLHVLATPFRVVGMFVAVLEQPSSFVPDVAQKLLSLLFINASSVLDAGTQRPAAAGDTTHLEETIRAQSAALLLSERSAKLASDAKAQFLAKVNHQLRTPLNGVLGMADLLLGSDLTPEQRLQSETIRRSGDRLLGLIDTLLDPTSGAYGGLEPNIEEISLRAVVEAAVRARTDTALANEVDLLIRHRRDVPDRVLADGPRIEALVGLLCDRALEGTRRGRILVELDTADTEHVQIVVSGPPSPDSEGTAEVGAEEPSPACLELAAVLGGEIVTTRDRHGERVVVILPLALGAAVGAHEWPSPLAGRAVTLVCRDHLGRGVAAEVVSDLGGSPVAFEAIEEVGRTAQRYEARDVLLIVGEDCVFKASSPFLGRWPGVRIAFVADPDAIRRARRRGFTHVGTLPLTHRAVVALLDPEPAERVLAISPGWAREGDDAPQPRSLARRGRVVIADDDPVSVRVAESMLRRLRCDPVCVSDGHAAVQVVTHGNADLVLLDCELPGLDGIGAAKAIRAWEATREVRVPIVALSAGTTTEERENALRAGMDDFLEKPVTVDALGRMLHRWIPVRTGEGRPLRAPAASPSLQRCVFDHTAALRQLGGDRALLGENLALFRSGWSDLKDRLQAAASRADLATATGAAHRIRGSASNVGAVSVWNAARLLEEAGRAGDADEVSRVQSVLEEEVDRFLFEVRAFMEEDSSW